MPATARPTHRTGIALACVALSFLLHASAFSLPFFLDDLVLFERVFPDGSFDGEEARAFLLPRDEEHAYNAHLRPVGWASILLDARMAGASVEGFRVTAFFLHGLTGFLVGLCAWRLGGRAGAGWTAGLLFVAWPGSAEPVVWVSHRFTLLATLFFFLACFAAIRYAREARGGALLLLAAGLGLFSKDSLLSLLFALPPVVLFLAPPERRWPRALRVLAAMGALVLANLAARRALLGTFLPRLSDEKGPLDALPSAEGLERTLQGLAILLAPLRGFSWEFPWCLAAAPVAGCLLFVVARALFLRGASAERGAMALLLATCGASLPVLVVFPDPHLLDGVRQLYLPAGALSVVIGLALARRGLVGGGLAGLTLLLAIAAQRANLDAWHESGHRIEEVCAEIEELAAALPDRPLFVCGLEATADGVPRFGRGATHLHIRFEPPLRERHLDVRGIEESALVAALAEAPGEAGVLLFGGAARSPEPAHDAAPERLHLVAAEASTAVPCRLPSRGGLWPGPDGAPRIHVEVGEATPPARYALFEVMGEDLHTRAILSLPQPVAGQLALGPAELLASWRPPVGLDALQARLGAPARPARLRIRTLAPPGASGWAVVDHPFLLGGHP